MPHLTLEYTDSLAPTFHAASALLKLNQALLDSGHFEEPDIKNRALQLDTYRTGTSQDARAFVHAKLAILSGRSAETKLQLSQALLRTLQGLCQWPAGVQVQLSVEVQDIDRPSYAKAIIG
jgi:5-carboxymethyl-2-hydroxymuconate isomerase